MATERGLNSVSRYDTYGQVSGNGADGSAERGLGELFRELANDGSALVRQELELAKREMREAASTITRDVAKIAVAAGVVLVGVLSLVAFLIVALGDALDNYWLSALIVGVVFLVAGGVMAKRAAADMKRQSMAPRETLETLREDKEWARGEVQHLKRRVKA